MRGRGDGSDKQARTEARAERDRRVEKSVVAWSAGQRVAAGGGNALSACCRLRRSEPEKEDGTRVA